MIDLEKIKKYREEVLDVLSNNQFYFGTKVINLNVDDKEINYHRWLHPWQGDWELEYLFNSNSLKNISKLIKPNTTILDIGAQTGNMSVAYSLFAKNVISFEPNPATYNVLEENSKLNKNITPYNLACSDKEDILEFHYSAPGLCNGGYASILNNGVGVTSHTHPLEVYAVNVCDFVKKHHPNDINNISFIKIDTEGHDKDILPTLKEIIKINKPIILTEIYDGLTEEETDQLIETINDLGYKAYDMNACGEDIDNLGEEIISHKNIVQGSGHNLICLP